MHTPKSGKLSISPPCARRLYFGYPPVNAEQTKTAIRPGELPADIAPALAETLRLREQAMERCSEGISIVDMRLPGAPLTYVNAGFEKLTGYSRAELLGRNCRFLQGPETSADSIALLRTAIGRGETATVELLNYRKDGTPFWNRLALTPLRDGTGAVTHYVGVQTDITQQVRSNAEVREALELLEQMNKQLTRANKRMKQNLMAAAKVQQALLPDRLPKPKQARFAWRLTPCDELAGDTLNIFRLDKTHIGVYLLDVTGHGTAAALLAVSVSRMLSPTQHTSSLVRSHEHDEEGCEEHIIPPAVVAENLNHLFPWDPETGQFFTLVYGILDTASLEFRFICAGHPGPVYVPAGGKPSIVRGSGLPIGLGDTHYEEQVLQLAPGDRIFLYSDGITEVMNRSRELFGRDRLLVDFQKNAAVTLDQCLDNVLQDVTAWNGSPRFSDDLSLLAVEATVVEAPSPPAA
jgi:sigma-B regulation protein RsbU (phosphoserine phosphatase)